MRTHIVVLTLFAITICANGQIEKDIVLQKRIQECFDETKVPTDLQLSNPTSLLDHPKLKCFSACMMKKKGTMKEGRIDPEKQLRAMHPDSYEVIKDVVNTCSTLANQQKDECEIAHSYVRCLIKNVSVYQG